MEAAQHLPNSFSIEVRPVGRTSELVVFQTLEVMADLHQQTLKFNFLKRCQKTLRPLGYLHSCSFKMWPKVRNLIEDKCLSFGESCEMEYRTNLRLGLGKAVYTIGRILGCWLSDGWKGELSIPEGIIGWTIPLAKKRALEVAFENITTMINNNPYPIYKKDPSRCVQVATI